MPFRIKGKELEKKGEEEKRIGEKKY